MKNCPKHYCYKGKAGTLANVVPWGGEPEDGE